MLNNIRFDLLRIILT